MKAGHKMSVIVAAPTAALTEFLPAWEDLAADALEPNVFYEPWMMAPALRHFGSDETRLTALIFAAEPTRMGKPLLCGLFPLECGRGYKGLPIKFLRLWRHKHCFLATPLIRAGYARETLEAFFDWLAADAGSGALMEFSAIPGEGPFHQALSDYLCDSGKPNHISYSYTRAFLRPAANAEAYLCAALSGGRRKRIRRKEEKLSMKGRLEWDAITSDDDVAEWIEEFLRLEASGWKGREGGALASNESERRYFEAVATEAFRRGRLMMLALRLDGRPIAYKCGFIAGRGLFSFKIAYDENYASHSPGALLEVENIRRLHAQSRIEWVDSCNGPLDTALKDFWLSRRTIRDVIVSTGKAPGDLIVSMIPLLKWLKLKIRLHNGGA